MLLAIDVGNTNTVFALHDGTEIVAEWRCRTERARTADEYFVWLQQLMANLGLKPQVRSVVISSVVPQVVFNLRVLSDRYFHTRPLVVGKPEVRLGPPPRVDPTTHVGADRLVNTVGAFDRYGGNLIVVDFGTATTFDVVGEDGAYEGGVIAPGVNRQSAISDTAVTSAALPVMKHWENSVSSSGKMRRSTTLMPRRRASSITVRRVMPSRKQSAVGVWIVSSLMKKMFAPVHSATRPCQSSIMASA